MLLLFQVYESFGFVETRGNRNLYQRSYATDLTLYSRTNLTCIHTSRFWDCYPLFLDIFTIFGSKHCFPFTLPFEVVLASLDVDLTHNLLFLLRRLLLLDSDSDEKRHDGPNS